VILGRLNNSVLIVHRVIRVGPDGFLVQGDAFSRPDGWILPSQVLGKVTGLTRGPKYYASSDSWLRLLTSLWIWSIPLRGVFLPLMTRIHTFLTRS
jgi:hypothetical protein